MEVKLLFMLFMIWFGGFFPNDIIVNDSVYTTDTNTVMKEVPKDTNWTTYKSGKTVKASWYGDPTKKKDKFHGRRSANGEIFDTYKFTCAHMKLPFGTIVRLTNVVNGNVVILRVTDRGAFDKYGRDFDISYGAMLALDGLCSGVINVKADIMRMK